ncbi:MAG: hypothetical protein EB072_00535 [Betaproteobacteria bacterium]|nr:hypothetical protein [Betaproteobacteria bacterium]
MLSAGGTTFQSVPLYGAIGNDTIAGTSNSDTIVSFAGTDLITPGLGADGVILGRGSKTIVYGPGDAGLLPVSGALSFSAGMVTIATNTAISTANFDVISGFGLSAEQSGTANDVIDLPAGNYTIVANYPSKSNLVSAGEKLALADFQWMQIKGNYDPIADNFKVSDAGKSTLLIYDAGPGLDPEAIMLVGFVGELVDDGIFGQLRPVIG